MKCDPFAKYKHQAAMSVAKREAEATGMSLTTALCWLDGKGVVYQRREGKMIKAWWDEATPWDLQHNQQKRWRVEPVDDVLRQRYASYLWPDEEDWFVLARTSPHLSVTSVQFTPRRNPHRHTDTSHILGYERELPIYPNSDYHVKVKASPRTCELEDA